MRTVTMDYVKGGKRTLLLSVLYLVGAAIFAMGTIVVFTVKLPGA
jgi:succinate dehydrogenase hydrophobic anchor subunit